MKFKLNQQFNKSFDMLPKQIQEKAQKALSLFMGNPIPPYHPSLRIKKIKGTNGIWEGRVDQFYRFTFWFKKDADTGETICEIRNVGRHDIIDHAP